MKTSRFGFTKLLGLSALLLVGTAAQAVTITVSGTADATGLGYTIGQPVTFTFVTPSSLTNLPSSFFEPTYNYWNEQTTTDDQIFTNVSGTGFSGTYFRPTTNLSDPNSAIYSDNTGYLQFFTRNDNSYGIGLTAGGFAVRYVQLDLQGGAVPTFPNSGSFVDPVSLLDAVAGTYNTIGANTRKVIFDTDGGTALFTVNELIITPDAAEVPFGVDSTTGLALLGAAAAWKLRRRRKTA